MNLHQKLKKIQNRGTLLFDATEIQGSLVSMSQQINEELQGENVILLCVLTGGLYTTYPLSRLLVFNHQIECIKATRYGNNTQGKELVFENPSIDLQSKTVLIVDDCMDEGITLHLIKKHCLDKGAEKVFTAVLLNKIYLRKKAIEPPNYYALTSDTKDFVYGHGLDISGYLRNLSCIYSIPPEEVQQIMSL
jgi:hypoxanthine phosphoribosyltransferase